MQDTAEPIPRDAARRFVYREAAVCPIDGAAPPPPPDLRIEGAPQTPTVRPPAAGWYGAAPFLPAPDPIPLPNLASAATTTMWDDMRARLHAGAAMWEGDRLVREAHAARYASLGSKSELAAARSDTT